MTQQYIVTRRDEDGTWYLFAESGLRNWSSYPGDAQRFLKERADELAALINAEPAKEGHITGKAKVVPVMEGT